MINSIKFYYETVMGMPNRFYSIDRPRKQESLPTVLSQSEVSALLASLTNLKHRCLLCVLYSTGVRRQELFNLKISDIDSKRMMIHIEKGKGGKDRKTLLSQNVLNLFREY